jgi:PKD repeat protein
MRLHMSHRASRLARHWWVMPLLVLWSCDGGTRGSGISGGFSTLTGSLAVDGASAAFVAAARGEAAEASSVVVQVREVPGATTTVDPLTHGFTLSEVPAGDITVDFIGETTSTFVLRGLPEDVSLHLVNVRFENGVAKPAGFGITPDEGNSASVETSRRKGPAPLEVVFNLTDVSLPTSSPVVWDFGDGTRSGRASTAHSYVAPGNYVVQATVTSGNQEQRAFQVIQVGTESERALEVTAVADTDRGLPPLPVNFSATVENNVGVVTYLWDFGDGSVPGEGASVRHLYTEEGLFLVQVTAFDQAGNESSDVVQIQVRDGTRPVPLTVKADVDSAIGAAPHRVQLRATITGPGPVTIVWDFDDGTPLSSAPAPVHTYSTPGRYFATVTVTDQASGDFVRDQVTIEVQ